MEFRSTSRRDEQFARQTERIAAELRASGLPLYALSPAARPAVQEQFGGLETVDGTITAVHLVYPTHAPLGFWADVETARWSDERTEPADLRETLKHHVRRAGDHLSSLTWEEDSTTLLVDGHRVDARRLRAGPRWWVMRGERAGIEITVVGRDWQPEACAVETVTDPVPILNRLRDGGRAHRPGTRPDREPEPLPDQPRGEPHRALADAVLRHAADSAAWRADGGSEPELPTYWTELWQAAVLRQMQLSGRDEIQAAAAVRAMAAQLAGLFDEHEWFRTDERLRGRAVTEVLFHTTGLEPDVRSRTAQEEWWHVTAIGADPRLRAAATDRWRTAWQTWASTDR
ncbi:hypothetical protein Aph02nite_64320 [Actinoplanes philippinensis]|uniref:Uncharacterized protein n=1 Tax=Actinoplanes philippinensis TaxID=35752 RepID=A0A1I2JRC8_9ACTN|nr:hypothetical protein [Actinoplanes philippinensis]GIE80482.1 hypothetical protein Aph02nite_64320 [Actinoplanes philippinensis]SFF55316.1 hypothetical protein SAMN05421541_11311 [Actinoplanes philippinensis]